MIWILREADSLLQTPFIHVGFRTFSDTELKKEARRSKKEDGSVDILF